MGEFRNSMPRILRLFFLPLFFAPVLSACSLIGFGIGALVDSRARNASVYTKDGLDSLQSSTRVNVVLEDSSVLLGDYKSLSPEPLEEYRPRYLEYRSSAASYLVLPQLGDTLRFIVHSTAGPQKEIRGLFQGFSPGTICIERLPEKGPKYAANILIGYVDTLYSQGALFADLRLLQDAVVQDHVPFVQKVLRLEQKDRVVSIPLTGIQRVDVIHSYNAKWYGLGVGAVLDALMVYSFATAEWHSMYAIPMR